MNNAEAISLIQEVLSGKITDMREYTARVNLLPAFHEESPVAEALHQTRHFITDADIRTKDPKYNVFAKKELQTLLSQLA